MAKVAVIGCGHWGKNLVRNFAELGALGAISDPNSELAAQFSSQFNVPALDFDTILQSDCDGVVIAAPALLHAPLSEKAFAVGKHVYVEKPLAMTLDEADAMIEAAGKANRQLMVGHLLQYHPVFARLREMVKNGDLGELQYVYSNRLSLGKVRSEEDVVWSFAPHDISMILSLAGQAVKTVRCEASDILQSGISDTASLHLSFENGLKGHVSCSWLHPYKEQKLVAIGSKAMAVFDDTVDWDQKLAIYDHVIDTRETPPVPQKSEVRHEKVPQGEPLKAECQYFLDLITGQADPLTDGAEGRRVLQVLAAASASINSGETIHA
jgi:UDP-2-acetamido-3-amino-2,3-dideoxy-glucuronate N-acetyltransferase